MNRMFGRRNGKVSKQLDAIPEVVLLERPTGLWRGAWRRLLRRKTGVLGMSIIGSLIVVAVFAPLIAPYDPTDVLIGKEDVTRRDPPCVHLLGCDDETPQHILGLDDGNRVAIVQQNRDLQTIFGSNLLLDRLTGNGSCHTA